MQKDERINRPQEKNRGCTDEHSAMLIPRGENRKNDTEQARGMGDYPRSGSPDRGPHLKSPGNYGEYYPVSNQGQQQGRGESQQYPRSNQPGAGGAPQPGSQYRPGQVTPQGSGRPGGFQQQPGAGQQPPQQYRYPGTGAGQQPPQQYRYPGTGAGQQPQHQYRQPGTGAGQQPQYQYRQPGTGTGQQSQYQYGQSGSGTQTVQSQGQGQGSQQTVVKNPGTNIVPRIKNPEMNDRDFLNDILATEKYLTSSFNKFLHEASHLALYNDLKQILNETHDCARDIFNLMFKDSFYSLKAAGKQELQQEQQKFSNYINCQNPYKKR